MLINSACSIRWPVFNERVPRTFAMIGLVRLYCYRCEEFLLVDATAAEADDQSTELIEDGWDIEAQIPV